MGIGRIPPDEAAFAEVRRAPRVALDTESDAFFAYRPRICLVQLSLPGRDWLVDPLAKVDLGALGRRLADPAVELVLHAAENDVLMLDRDFGWRIGRLFDTQVACFVLGLRPYSLAGLLETRFGVCLDKRLQRSDWSRRPLTPAQVAYAAEDTRHLLDLAEDLQGRARAAGREEEVAAECSRIAARRWEEPPADPDAFRRLAGARDLDGVSLRVLRDVHRFREEEARRRNRAPFRIVGDGALVALAARRATAPVGGVPRSFWGRYGDRVAALVRRAVSRGPLPPRKRAPHVRGPMDSRATKRRYDALRRWRGRAAAERGVEGFVVARNELLLEVARRGCRTLEDLSEVVEPFRLREYGEAMLRVVLDSACGGPDNEADE
ncbi:MAG: ribonuclease D [Planctomycetota bacterium]